MFLTYLSYSILVPETSPETMFTKENAIRTIIARLPIESAKAYMVVGIFFMIVSRVKFFEGYKIQSVDNIIPWSKFLKVIFSSYLKQKMTSDFTEIISGCFRSFA